MKREIWRDIAGFEGLYKVSDLGRVKSVSRIVRRKNGSVLSVSEKILHLTASRKTGHVSATLCRNGVCSKFYVHRLVLETFVGSCPPGMECRHFPDRDPANNRLDNLSWGTHEQNMRDMDAHGTRVNTPRLGEDHGMVKITEKDVREIRRLIESGEMRQVEVAAKYGLNRNHVYAIRKRRSWKHVA